MINSIGLINGGSIMFGRKQLAMLLAEFIGTATLALVVYTIVGRTSFPLFAALAAGGTVALFTVTVGAFSGAHLNPAITFGLWSVRRISTFKAVANITFQFLGGLAAYALIKYFLGHSLESVAGTEFSRKVFAAEAIGTMIFAFGFASAIFQKHETSKNAAIIGGSLFVGILVASLASNAVLNPAVAAGIYSWSWAYASAPFLGALVGINLYGMVFADESTFPTRLVKAKSSTSRTKSTSARAKSTSARAKTTTKSTAKNAPARKKPASRKK